MLSTHQLSIQACLSTAISQAFVAAATRKTISLKDYSILHNASRYFADESEECRAALRVLRSIQQGQVQIADKLLAS